MRPSGQSANFSSGPSLSELLTLCVEGLRKERRHSKEEQIPRLRVDRLRVDGGQQALGLSPVEGGDVDAVLLGGAPRQVIEEMTAIRQELGIEPQSVRGCPV